MDATKFSKGNSSYLKAKDCTPFNATITDVIESLDFDKNECLVIELNDDKKIQLKPGNVKQLIDLFGEDTNEWQSQNVAVKIGSTMYKDEPFPVFVFDAYEAPGATKPQAENPPKANLKVDPLGL